MPRSLDPVSGLEQVLHQLSTRAPTLGGGRVVAIDGPAGSGKTTLAEALGRRVDATVVHMDDLYEGWDGLPAVDAQLETLLEPLAGGRPGRYRRWDWVGSRWAEEVEVAPAPLLVVEGVGAGSQRAGRFTTVLVWVEAPHDVRMGRGLERDGEAFAPHWVGWASAEAAHFARHRTRERADVVVDGTVDARGSA